MSEGLVLDAVRAGYGRLEVLHDVSLRVPPGEVVCLLGPNGSGKTTLLLSAVGQLPLAAGRITVDGRPISTRRPSVNARNGMCLVPDNRGVFLQLSVAENLRLVHPRRGTLDDVAELFPALVPLMKRRAGLLSGGEQQMLAIAKAVLFGPKVLLIDEMSHGLAPLVSAKLLTMVRHLAQSRGTAVLLVEQIVDMALDVSDRAAVMRHGRIVLEGAATDVANDRALLESHYLGQAAV